MILKETGNPVHPNRMFNCGNSATLSHIPQSALSNGMVPTTAQTECTPSSTLPQTRHPERNTHRAFRQVPVAPPVSSTPPFPSPLRSNEAISPTSNQSKTSKTSPSLELPRPSPTTRPIRPNSSPTPSTGVKNTASTKNSKRNSSSTPSQSTSTISAAKHTVFRNLPRTDRERDETARSSLPSGLPGHCPFRSTGVPNYIFQEINNLAQAHYQYQSRQDPFSYVMKLALTLPDEPLETYPKANSSPPSIHQKNRGSLHLANP